MKQKILSILVSATLCCSIVGCTTTQQSVAIKTEGVIVVTVDTGMKAWATYVNSGKATIAQVNAVENAYNNYYTAQVAAEAALVAVVSNTSTNTADINIANTYVTAAESQLLTLINSYIK